MTAPEQVSRNATFRTKGQQTRLASVRLQLPLNPSVQPTTHKGGPFMNKAMRNLLRAAEQAVGQFLAKCRKGDPLYVENPKAVAQVSRTGKWLLNALTALNRELKSSPDDDNEPPY